MSYKRRTRKNKKGFKKRWLILCEGETERNYFLAMREDETYQSNMSSIEIKIVKAKHNTPEMLVKEAIQKRQAEKRKKNPYSTIWLVFDHDFHPHRKAAYLDAKAEKFEVAFTAICFELWYLLHFVKSAKAFTLGKHLETDLKKYYPNYTKAKQNDFENLKDKLPIALKNAAWLQKQIGEDNEMTDRNPWTDVDILVRQLQLL